MATYTADDLFRFYDDDFDDDEINGGDEDDEHEFGCCFPGRCLMPSPDHSMARRANERRNAPMTTTASPAPLPPELVAKAAGATRAYRRSLEFADDWDDETAAEAALLAADVPGLMAERDSAVRVAEILAVNLKKTEAECGRLLAENEHFRVSASQLKWLGELPADERARLVKIYFGDFTKIEQERDEAQRAAALHRDMDNFNHALLEKARAENAEARTALAFLMRDVDAVTGVSNKDRYDFAVDVARERGHEEPTAEDELDGFLRLIVEARRVMGSKEEA